MSMKKVMSYLLCIAITSSSVLANQDADTCKSLKGDWVWNGTLNQWQCEDLSDADKDTYAKYIIEKGTSEGNITAVHAQPHNNETSGISAKDVLVAAATPVVIAGAIVAAVVVSPIWIIKKITGND
ncbi:hypothetical protein Sulku_2626 (plasmid) [Sulfuricurvum kujiense DSM 16994]|uniref:Uncharacterized protein n=1 Tax=Sulfuricurvum kujiense (strain ATCC BAA-921 / DSM 16994 / JCM 11577 / YK-1) TaxID=709032 RepID=E4U3L3_SULKY|nr:hypothetical protein [Sulfuricurvum kujiense]ADR35279.1 hypothetical protein Sulku_2626 [Sulfuricurvum kujiense DSM 16994]